jgi:hypothetical protein
MLLMRVILIALDTWHHTRVRDIICRNGIEVWSQILLRKSLIAFTHVYVILLRGHLEYEK